MARIALVNIGMHGHVNPTMGFTEELIRRGHEVLFFSTQEFAPLINKSGATFIDYPSNLGQNTAMFAKAQAEATAEGKAPPASGSIMVRFLDEFGSTFGPLYDNLSRLKPDIIVYDFVSLAARLIGEHLGIKTIKFCTTYASNAHYSLMKETFAKHDFPSPVEIAQAQSFIDKICSQYQCQSTSLLESFNHIDDYNLVFMPKSFQPHGQTFDQRFNFVGPCVRTAAPSDAESLIPKGDGPVMVISLGSLFHEWPEFYQACFAAFGPEQTAGTGISSWRVVMAIGSRLDPNTLGTIPSNFRVVPYIPQVELLQSADLFISHGGMNSTMESLYYGVPLVVVPQIEEQEVTGRRVGEMRLGKYLKRTEVDSQVLGQAVKEVFGQADIKANVLAMRDQIHAAGGSRRAADLIETLINTSSAGMENLGQLAVEKSASNFSSKTSPNSPSGIKL